MEVFLQRLSSLPKEMKHSRPSVSITEIILTFTSTLPILHDLKSDALRERHWKRLMGLSLVGDGHAADSYQSPTAPNLPSSANEVINLGRILSLKLHRHLDAVSEIVSMATKELNIEHTLADIDAKWSSLKFNFSRFVTT